MWLEWQKDGNVRFHNATDNKEIEQRCSGYTFFKKTRLFGTGFEDRVLLLSFEGDAGDVYKITEPTREYDCNLLKSQIEKSIRRRCRSYLTPLVLQFINQNINHFLSLLMHFIAVNVPIHKDTLKCFWIYVAVKNGWKITQKQVVLIVNILNEVKACKYRDVLTDNIEYRHPIVPCEQTSILQNNDLLLKSPQVYWMIENHCAALLLNRAMTDRPKRSSLYMICSVMIWKRRMTSLNVSQQMQWIQFLEPSANTFNTGRRCYNFTSEPCISVYDIDDDDKVFLERVEWEDIKDKKYNIEKEFDLDYAIDYHHFPSIENQFPHLRNLIFRDHKLHRISNIPMTDEAIIKTLWFYRTVLTTKISITNIDYCDRLSFSNMGTFKEMIGMRQWKSTWNLIRPYCNQSFSISRSHLKKTKQNVTRQLF